MIKSPPTGFQLRDQGNSFVGVGGQHIITYTFVNSAAGAAFVVAVHRGNGVLDALRRPSMTASNVPGPDGHQLYQDELPIPLGREVAWSVSATTAVWVTSSNLGLSDLTSIALAVEVSS